MPGSSRIAASSRSNASPASNGTSICRRWRFDKVLLLTLPAISRTRRRWENALTTTSASAPAHNNNTNQCGSPEPPGVIASTTRNRVKHQTATRRTRKNRLLIIGVSSGFQAIGGDRLGGMRDAVPETVRQIMQLARRPGRQRQFVQHARGAIAAMAFAGEHHHVALPAAAGDAAELGTVAPRPAPAFV